MREGIALSKSSEDRPSLISRLSTDIDTLWRRCKEVWDSVGDNDGDEEARELDTVRGQTRRFGIHTSRDAYVSGSRLWHRNTPGTDPLSIRVKSPDSGSAIAATVGSSIAWVLPTGIAGTHSVYQTIVHAGTQVALPTYNLVNGQLVVDHYSVLTAPTSIQGWIPNAVSTLSPWVIPVFAATFSVAHALDSVHARIHNRCSTRAALKNVMSGGVAGAVVGSLYYSFVSFLGIGYAPVVSGSLCVTWLVTSYFFTKKVTSSDVFVGIAANAAGIAAFVYLSNPWISVIASLAGTLGARGLVNWISFKWSQHLRNRLINTARQVLGVSDSVDRAGLESAYRRMARIHHPDKRGTREFFELLHVSKEILLANILENTAKHSSQPSLLETVHQFLASITAPVVSVTEKSGHKIELPVDFLHSPD